MWWNKSLRNRLFVALALGMVSCMTALFFIFDDRVHYELYRRFDASLTNRARTAALYFGAVHEGALSQSQVLPEFRLGQHREFFQVWDAHNLVVARSEASGEANLLRPHTVSINPTHFDLLLPDGHRGRGVAQVFALPAEDPRQSLTVVVAEERDQIDALERKLHAILVLGTALTLMMLLVVVRLTVNRGLRPLARYAQQVTDMEIHDGAPVPEPQSDLPLELQPVARQMSTVLAELTQALSRERRFARDVAHELRTPIAEARALAETALQTESSAVLQHHLREIGAAMCELDSIVSSLLLIARYESGIEQPMQEPINLADELRQHLERVAVVSTSRQLQWQTHLPAECWIQSDPILLGRVLANLIDNAVAHAPQHSVIHLQLQTDPIQLSCRNAAPLLTDEAVAQLGERFVRAPTSATGAHHAGLGLALCLTISKVLKLHLNWQRLAGPPAQFSVTLAQFELLPTAPT